MQLISACNLFPIRLLAHDNQLSRGALRRVAEPAKTGLQQEANMWHNLVAVILVPSFMAAQAEQIQ
jgi:hypothetical protein